MPITSILQLKTWFKKGLKPLESQYHAWLDSYWHKSEKLPISSITNLDTTLNNFVTIQQVLPLFDSINGTDIQVPAGSSTFVLQGTLLECFVANPNGASIDFSIGTTAAGEELVAQNVIDAKSSFRCDYALESGQNTFYINTSFTFILKIYYR